MNNYRDVKAITFDFWGVFAVMNPPMNRYLEERGISLDGYTKEIHDLVMLHDLGKIDERQFFQKCSQIIGVEIPYDQCRYVYREGTLNEPLISLVKKLKENYKIALLSNNNKEYVQEYIRKPGLGKLFDVEVISYETGHRKPDPEIYKTLIQRLGMKPSEILFLDDDPTKLTAAETQGLKTLVYEGKKTDEVLKSLVA
ncbi:MAG: HAD family phosphatase [Candidatus Jorgensenbacteria bacterium]|nr:HAD family phosphatase [Candidatus Jorgensenbacteria bacterium]